MSDQDSKGLETQQDANRELAATMAEVLKEIEHRHTVSGM